MKHQHFTYPALHSSGANHQSLEMLQIPSLFKDGKERKFRVTTVF